MINQVFCKYGEDHTVNNTLLFHIGRMKTGTTALQVFLHENVAMLKQYGWCYPDLRKELPQIRCWNVMNRGKNGTIFYTEEGRIDEFAENWIEPWKRILKYLEKYNVIISSEDIANRDTGKFLKLAKKKYENIKVVMYLRRQDRAVESAWNQEIKGDWVCNTTIHEYLTEETIESLHYLRQLNQISDIVGKENLIVKVYEKQQFQGENHTIMSDFLSIIDIEPDWSKWKDCHIQNPRLSGNYFELKKIFNSIRSVGYENISNPFYADIFVKLSQKFCCESGEEGYFTVKEREDFLKQFAWENKQIAHVYLHRDNGCLFGEDTMNYPLRTVNSCTPFEQDIVRVLSAMVCSLDERMLVQSREIQRLKEQNNNLTAKMLLNNRKERKILLFGAGYKCRELLRNNNLLPVSAIVDNDEKKSGELVCGIKVSHARDIIDWTGFYVVVTCVETDEIEKQLCGYGLKKEYDYVLAKEY